MAAALLALCTAGCDESVSDLTSPTPDLQPTFSSIQRDIFERGDSSGRQACVTCHTPAQAPFSGGLDLSHNAAYAALVAATSPLKPGAVRVVAGDPEASYLIHKLEGRATIVGVRMPQGGPFLSHEQVDVIRRWIERGARND